MAKTSNSEIAIIAEAHALAGSLETFKLKLPNGLDAPKVNAHVAVAQASVDKVDDLRKQLEKAIVDKQTHIKALQNDAKNIRTGVKAVFGDDSAEYKMVGGTRLSERKKPTTKG